LAKNSVFNDITVKGETMKQEILIQEILRTEKTGTSKQALKPSEGIYYVIPRKKGNPIVVSRRTDEHENEDELLHMFFWTNVLRSIAHEYKLKPLDVEDLKDNYMAIPRGRVQKEFDVSKQEYTGNYVIFHGGDVPTSLISNFIYQDFGLAPLASEKKVKWQVESHEKMSKEDREKFNQIVKKKK
jgi:hypothetical protein